MTELHENKFQKFMWMVDEAVSLHDKDDEYKSPYGDITELNTCRLIKDSVGNKTLNEIGEYAIKLLDTSVAIYEANGDYAFGMFSSQWCRTIDTASRELCKTDDNQKALSCGKWLCHENCWNDSAKKAIETGKSTDIECVGGIHLYAEPIFASQKIIGVINIGYGDPPKDPNQLEALSNLFGVDAKKLQQIAASYKSRPKFIVDIAKRLLVFFAQIIGEIVEKEEARDTLSKVLKRNQALLDHSPVCHKIVDLDFNLQYMSANGFKMLKLDDNAQVYGNPYPFDFFPTTFRDAMTRKMKKVIETGDTVFMEALTKDLEGNDVCLSSTLIPVFDHDGEIEYLTIVSADTTWRMQEEKEKKRLEEQLYQSQKMESIGSLAGGIAHDFNNILTAIIGNNSFAMEMVQDNTEILDCLEQVHASAERAANLTRQLLAFSRKQILQPKIVNINELIMNFDKMVRRLIGEDIEYVTIPNEHIWEVKVDPGQIEQVLINLVVNARDSMPLGGKITIETQNVTLDDFYVSNHLEAKAGEYVMLAVSDTGTGIDENCIKYIFDPFYTTKEIGKGTGLGLSTVHGIIKQSGGIINVYSEPGKGTTFKIYLPKTMKGVKTQQTEDVELKQFTGCETILVTEDDEMVRSIAVDILSRAGYHVLPATYGAEAIKVFQQSDQHIHLLITDVIMPKMSGKDLANQLLQQQPNLKILYMSGYTDNAIVHHGMLDEGIHFLQKPFTPIAILQKVKDVLDKS